MAHAYKDIETTVLLKMIPIEDVIEYYGQKFISYIGIEEALDYIGEEEILQYIEKTGLLKAIEDKLKQK